MATYKCPCCGAPYNGKRCRSCNYEAFTEEVSHGLHTHEGEPLAIKEPEPKKASPVKKQHGDCDSYSGKRKSGSMARTTVIVAVVISLVSMLGSFISAIQDTVSDVIEVEEETIVDTSAFQDGTVLYDDGEITVTADWRPGDSFDRSIPLLLTNQTDKDIIAATRWMSVNGFSTDDTFSFCRAEAGETVEGDLWIDQNEMDDLGLGEVTWLSFCLEIEDDENYDTIATTDRITLGTPVDGTIPPLEEDKIFYQADGITLSFLNFDGTACEDGYLLLRVDNDTDSCMEVCSREFQVNSETAQLFLYTQIAPCSWTIEKVRLANLDKLELEQIADIVSMSVSVDIQDISTPDVWTTTDAMEITIR